MSRCLGKPSEPAVTSAGACAVLCELNTPRGAGTAREPKSCPPSRSQPSSRAWLGVLGVLLFWDLPGKEGRRLREELWMLCPSSAPPATWIRVDPDRDFLGTGRDWEHSWHSLQQGFPVTLPGSLQRGGWTQWCVGNP